MPSLSRNAILLFSLSPFLAACSSGHPCDQSSQLAFSVRSDLACPSVAEIQTEIDSEKPTDRTRAIDLADTGSDAPFSICWYRVISDSSTCNGAASRGSVREELTSDLGPELDGAEPGVFCANGSDPALYGLGPVDVDGGIDCAPQGDPYEAPYGVTLGGLFARDDFPTRTRCTYDVEVTETCGGGSIPLFGLQ